MPQPVVFLDRDGTLIEDTGYLRDPVPVELLPFVAQGIREIRQKGYLIFVVSNQSGVGRGIISKTQFESVHEKVVQILKNESASVDGFGYCFHKPDDFCKCRKPEIGLIPNKILGKEVEFLKSHVVGDRLGDLQLGHRIGAASWLVLTGVGKKTESDLKLKKLDAPLDAPWCSCENLLEFAKRIPTVQSSL